MAYKGYHFVGATMAELPYCTCPNCSWLREGRDAVVGCVRVVRLLLAVRRSWSCCWPCEGCWAVVGCARGVWLLLAMWRSWGCCWLYYCARLLLPVSGSWCCVRVVGLLLAVWGAWGSCWLCERREAAIGSERGVRLLLALWWAWCCCWLCEEHEAADGYVRGMRLLLALWVAWSYCWLCKGHEAAVGCVLRYLEDGKWSVCWHLCVASLLLRLHPPYPWILFSCLGVCCQQSPSACW